MEPYQERVLEEARFEANKLKKLNEFMSSDKFTTLSRIEKDLQYEQVIVMNRFVQVLGKRLEFYGIEFSHKKEIK